MSFLFVWAQCVRERDVHVETDGRGVCGTSARAETRGTVWRCAVRENAILLDKKEKSGIIKKKVRNGNGKIFEKSERGRFSGCRVL